MARAEHSRVPRLASRARRRAKVALLGLTCLALLSSGGEALAGAWTQLAGSFYLKVSFGFSSADEQIKGGETIPLLDFSDEGTVWEGVLSFYGEYGLPLEIPGGLTVLGSLPYKFQEIDSVRALRRTEGIGDLMLGVRWGIPVDLGPVVMALQADVGIPTGYTANLPDGRNIPWLGNGVFNQTTQFLIGASFYPAPVYATGGFGFRYRGSAENDLGEINFANELPFNLETGVTIAELLLVRATFDGIINTEDTLALEVAALTPPSSRQIRVGGGLIAFLPLGFQVSFDYNRVVDGANAVLSDAFTFGFAFAQ